MKRPSISEVIREAWSRVLDIPDPQAEDNFFMQGGDSLYAVEFITIVERELEIEVPFIALFGDGTLGGLIEACEEIVRSREGSG